MNDKANPTTPEPEVKVSLYEKRRTIYARPINQPQPA